MIFGADMLKDNIGLAIVEGQGVMDCIFHDLPLLPNLYIASVFVLGKTPIIKIVLPGKEVPFTVTFDDGDECWPAMSLIRSAGIIAVKGEWRW